MTSGSDRNLVSIVIACHNQAQFLGEALASVCAQTYRPLEVLVIDDGSTDDTPAVVGAHAHVRYVRQRHQGVSAARNTGLRESSGPCVVFLDADDRLLPHAVETGVSLLAAHPECAFVAGHYCLIAADGSLLSRWPRRPVDPDPYTALLHHNHIGMHATVMYRRAILEEAAGFDTDLTGCEDYDLLLRITRQHPTLCYDTLIAEYRQHGSNTSRDPVLMLRSALAVHRRQWNYAQRDPHRRQVYLEGRTFWQEYYGSRVVERLQARAHDTAPFWTMMRDLAVLAVYYPKGFAASYQEVVRALSRLDAHRRRLGQGVQWLGREGRGLARIVLPLPMRRWIRRLQRAVRPARPHMGDRLE